MEMSATDKAKNKAQQGKGMVKETAGQVSGDDSLRAKGKTDQVKAKLKDVGEKVKDVFRR
jgi:uncharacterized protein YjbJ (UPF0337 family)